MFPLIGSNKVCPINYSWPASQSYSSKTKNVIHVGQILIHKENVLLVLIFFDVYVFVGGDLIVGVLYVVTGARNIFLLHYLHFSTFEGVQNTSESPIDTPL